MKKYLFWTLTALATLASSTFGGEWDYPLPPDMPSLDKRITALEAKVAALEAKCGVTTASATAPVTYRQECVNGVCRMVPVTTAATNPCPNCICPAGTVCGTGNCVQGCPGVSAPQYANYQPSYQPSYQPFYSGPMYGTPMRTVRGGLFGGGGGGCASCR